MFVSHETIDDVDVSGTTGLPVQPAIGTLLMRKSSVPLGTESELTLAISVSCSDVIARGSGELVISTCDAEATIAEAANDAGSAAMQVRMGNDRTRRI